MVRNLLEGLDDIPALRRYTGEHPEVVPPAGSGRETKLILVAAFARSLWHSLGEFATLDTDGDGKISASEVAAAVARATGEPASPITVDLIMDALDQDRDGTISPDEAAAAVPPRRG
jgi:hypothetical protein